MYESSIKEGIKEYWDWRGKDYDKCPGHNYQSREIKTAWMNVLKNAFETNGELKILDVGTGTGAIALLLAELGHDVTGMDVSEGMMKTAKDKADKLNLQINFELGDAENLRFKDNSFDGVICRHLLWTLPNPEKAVEEWIRVIKPGGKIAVIDGKWHDGSLKSHIGQLIWRMRTLIYKRSTKWHYRKEIRENLPLVDGAEPEKVIKIFKDHGLVNTSIRDLSSIREVERKNSPLLYGMLHAYPTFLIEGIKKIHMNLH